MLKDPLGIATARNEERLVRGALSIIDGQKIEPRPKLKGVCQCCSGEMVAKCGRVKQWHWAHKSKSTCDPWWESYYQNMIWIIDGNRGQFYVTYVNMFRSDEPIQNDPIAYSIDWHGRSQLFHNWADTKCRVFFDFGDSYLWQLIYFDPVKNKGAVGLIIKEQLIKDCLTGNAISLTATTKKELVNESI